MHNTHTHTHTMKSVIITLTMASVALFFERVVVHNSLQSWRGDAFTSEAIRGNNRPATTTATIDMPPHGIGVGERAVHPSPSMVTGGLSSCRTFRADV